MNCLKVPFRQCAFGSMYLLLHRLPDVDMSLQPLLQYGYTWQMQTQKKAYEHSAHLNPKCKLCPCVTGWNQKMILYMKKISSTNFVKEITLSRF